MANLLEKALRAGDQATIRRINRYVEAIENLETFYREKSDTELKAYTEDFKERYKKGESLDSMLPEAFAVAREACYRVLGKFPYRVQLMGGTALHFGNIAEMKTGEGKALTVDTLLPTPSGRKVSAGDVEVGDYLLDRYSIPTKVTGVFPQGFQKVYRLTVEDGRYLDCNLEHLWSFYSSSGQEGELLLGDTSELLRRLEEGEELYLPSAVKLLTVADPDIKFLEEISSKRDSMNRVFIEDSGSRERFMKTVYSSGLSAKPIKTYPGYFELAFDRDLVPYSMKLRISSIEDLGVEKEQVCFTVDNSEKLFLAGDYLVTHNTLTAVLPSYLNAISGKGVHVVTVNDYLASTQAEQMGRVYSFLGVSSAYTGPKDNAVQKREAYAKDITYGTNNEFGFDYLRDNMAKNLSDKVQRGHNFIIVDEADSILIDEARTPLIISGSPGGSTGSLASSEEVWYRTFAKLAGILKKDRDYEVDEKDRIVDLYDSAIDLVEAELGVGSIFSKENSYLYRFLTNSLKAKELFKKDKDYVVKDGEVAIVDEHTGRVLDGRRYSEGIHQALEAKEGVEIQEETMTVATITLQNYFKLYETLSGMTGTALSEASELMDTYKTGVIPIPTNRTPQRIDHEDTMFVSSDARYRAVIEEVKRAHSKGQPILIGTSSVSNSERISRELTKAGIKHDVLNAKNHAREAAIISQAGRKGAVTVATNMAGRGTDILLGGNPEWDAERLVKSRGISPTAHPEAFAHHYKKTLKELEEHMEKDKQEVIELGGLYVIGTERHKSRRIDDQLKGRSGRQGDKGESRFFLSLEDELFMLFGSNLSTALRRSGSDVEISSKLISKIVSSAQMKVGSRDAEQRKNVLKYDDVLTKQREVVYRERDKVLEQEDPVEIIKEISKIVLEDIFEDLEKKKSKLNLEVLEIEEAVREVFAPLITLEDLKEEFGGDHYGWNLEDVEKEYQSDLDLQIRAITERLGETSSRILARNSLLDAMDEMWPLNLQELDYLKKGIGLRSLAQKDPLVEYQREAILMFSTMLSDIRKEALRKFVKNAKPGLGNSIKGLISSDPEMAQELSSIQAALKTKKALLG